MGTEKNKEELFNQIEIFVWLSYQVFILLSHNAHIF